MKMKQIFTLMLFFAFGLAFGQNSSNVTESNRNEFQGKDFPDHIILPGNWENATSVSMETMQDEAGGFGGWLFGNNIHGIEEAGQEFELTETIEISGAYFWIGSAAEGPGDVHFNVYEFNGAPGNVIASVTIPLNDIEDYPPDNGVTPGDFMNSFYVEFDNPVTLEDDFFMGVDFSGLSFSSAGDGIGLASGENDAPDKAWIKHPSAGWMKASAVGTVVDLGIFPVLASETHTVTFEVLDEDGDPLDDAIVTFGDLENDPGDYVFEDMEEGFYIYTVEKEGYITVTGNIIVEDDVSQSVTLIPETYEITFSVLDESEEVLDDAVVTLNGEEGAPGEYVFEDVAPGTYSYTVEKEGYYTEEGTIEVNDDKNVEVILQLITYDVTFAVYDEDENAITNAVVTFDGTENAPGDYLFEDVEPGNYDYTVEKEGYHTVSGNLDIEEDTIVEIILELITYDVTFAVYDEDENAITDAVVTFNGTENAPGDYLFEDVEPGNYDYTVEKEGYHTFAGNIIIDNDTTVDVNLVLITYEVVFSVVDLEGQPLDNAVVTFNGEENTPGDYVFEDVEPGYYHYTVDKAGYITYEGSLEVEEDTVVEVVLEEPVSAPGLEEVSLSIYPNPASSAVNILSEQHIEQLRLIDMLGQVVYTAEPGQTDYQLNVSGFNNGVYFIQILFEEGSRTKRLQITR